MTRLPALTPNAAKPHSRPSGVFGQTENTVRVEQTCHNSVGGFDEVVTADSRSSSPP